LPERSGHSNSQVLQRTTSNFPPITHAVLLTVRSRHETHASFSAETLARRLREALPNEYSIGDPGPAPLEKLQGQYRFHILLWGRAVLRLSRLLRDVLDRLPFPEEVSVAVDVDPYQLL
jgi:primosomal protein N' (replication factor Y)